MSETQIDKHRVWLEEKLATGPVLVKQIRIANSRRSNRANWRTLQLVRNQIGVAIFNLNGDYYWWKSELLAKLLPEWLELEKQAPSKPVEEKRMTSFEAVSVVQSGLKSRTRENLSIEQAAQLCAGKSDEWIDYFDRGFKSQGKLKQYINASKSNSF